MKKNRESRIEKLNYTLIIYTRFIGRKVGVLYI